MLKALNAVTGLLPDEVVDCPHHARHDSAVDVVNNNGNLLHGWAVALSCEIKGQIRPRHLSKELSVGYYDENKVKSLNMDPVWKAKVLEIFALRRNARRVALREDSLMNR
jgi:hypothetical protein